MMSDEIKNTAAINWRGSFFSNTLKSGPLLFVASLIMAAQIATKSDILPATWWHWFCLVTLIVLTLFSTVSYENAFGRSERNALERQNQQY